EVDPDLLGIVRQPRECAQDVRHQHKDVEQRAVANVDQIEGVRGFPRGQVRGFADFTRGLGVAFHSAHAAPRRSFDARGLTATYTTRWSRLPRRTNVAAIMAIPMIAGKSRSCAACQAIRPMPGQLKTCSTMTAPPRMNGIFDAMISVIGIKSPSLKACLQTEAPLARAVRM